MLGQEFGEQSMHGSTPSSGEAAILATAHWIEGVILGGFDTSVATIVIAGTGLLMLQGRFPAAHAMRALLGCFILFSSAPIAAGLIALGHGDSGRGMAVTPPDPPAFDVPKSAPDHDPYAGASVPM